MAGGNNWPAVVEDQLPPGSVLMASGRVSGVHQAGEMFDEAPFRRDELVRLDNALTDATRATKVRFTIYLGDLGADPAAGADAVFPSTPDAAQSILIAVSPNQRAVEVRSGADVATRANDRVCQLGVSAAVSEFAAGDLIDGLISSVRVMAAAL